MKLYRQILIVAFCFAAQQSHAATPAETRQRTEEAHLVGHEDDLLLKRIDDALAEWDPRTLQSPYLQAVGSTPAAAANGHVLGERLSYTLRRPDLAEFIADPNAALVLGKALFWEMRAGSDSGSKDSSQRIYGTACASCHYRFGADPRDKNTEALAYAAWEKFANGRPGVAGPSGDTRLAQRPTFSQRLLPFTPEGEKSIGRNKFSEAGSGMLPEEIVGSAGVVRKAYAGLFNGVEIGGEIDHAELSNAKFWVPRFEMFLKDNVRTRQITRRNSPSIFNAVFNDRQFHDGRAESTFNGFSIFGDFDKRAVLKKARLGAGGVTLAIEPASVALVNASLASQAVGPIVNEVEMSYLGRTFHDLAVKLLPLRPLSDQVVSPSDSVLGAFAKAGQNGLHYPVENPPDVPALTYRELVKKAFRREWWADDAKITANSAFQSRFAKSKQKFLMFYNSMSPGDKNLVVPFASPAAQTTLTPLDALELVGNVINDERKAKRPIPPAVEKLYELVREWVAVDGEILPLRLYAPLSRNTLDVDLMAASAGGPNGLTAKDDLMVNNFSLYWGISIMLYESILISNQSPFDEMMRGNGAPVQELWKKLVTEPLLKDTAEPADDTDLTQPDARTSDEKIRRIQLDKLITKNAPPELNGPAMFQRGFRVFALNCAECHEPPFFTAAADLELAPELPNPIAQMHSQSLIRTAMADAFKARLIEEGQDLSRGIDDGNRALLGARRFFFDQIRIPELESTQAPLLIENMEIPDTRPASLTLPAPPNQPAPPRSPMITWTGTRPPLGFAESQQAGEKPVDPYAFYDLGFYNIGVSEPRYDWGVWKFAIDPTADDFAGLGVAQVQNGLAASPSGEDVIRGMDSLGSAYTLPRDFVRAPTLLQLAAPAAGPGQSLAEDHSRERAYLDDPSRRGKMHFFKRARRMVMTEENWGHRKPFITDNELMGWGAFKAPSLRNVSLTEPYMHNGRFLTLRQVLKFYSFDNPNLIPAEVTLNPDLHPEMGRLAFDVDGKVAAIGPLNLTRAQDAEALLFFLHCLTDPRVAFERGPFDHPSILVPNGFSNSSPEQEMLVEITEVGAEGQATVPRQFPTSQ